MSPQRDWGKSARRLAVEIAVIALSILLAFALDAEWDRRQRTDEVLEILDGLENEFSSYREELDRGYEVWDSVGGEIETLLLAIEEGRELPLAQARISMFGVLYPRTYDPGSGVRDALIASGRLELIEGAELRRQLVAWEGVLREVQDNETAMRGFILNQIIPYLARRHVPLGFDGFGKPRTGMTREEELAAYRTVLSDPEFMALASTRYGWLRGGLPEYRRASDFTRTVVEQIAHERAQY